MCSLYGNGTRASGGLVCTSDLGFTDADKQTHVHRIPTLSGHSPLQAQATFDAIYVNGSKLNIHTPARIQLAQKPEPMEYHCVVGRPSYLWCLGFPLCFCKRVISIMRMICGFGTKKAGSQ